LAIEYNGLGWHLSDESIERDRNKKKLCDNKKITLIVIVENNRNYESDVKNQLIGNLDIINKITCKNFTELDVSDVDCSNVYDDIFKMKDINEIKRKILECSSIKEFQKKYISEYNFLRRNKKLKLLDGIRNRIEYSDEELIQKCKEISDFSIFLKNNSKLYHICKNRGLIDVATAHMVKIKKRPYKCKTNDELIDLANKFNMKSQIKKENYVLFLELERRNLFGIVTYNPNFKYKHIKTILKEESLQKCFDDAKKYNNYSDFKKDKELYKRCVNYKIVRKIIDAFYKIDMSELILKESKKYKNFKEFMETIWYRRTKSIKGLMQKIKKQNNWSFYNKEKQSYVKMFPEIVKMINENVSLSQITRLTGIHQTTIWRIKKEMNDIGILKVSFNIKCNK
jgi:L-rhamnose mutarotase